MDKKQQVESVQHLFLCSKNSISLKTWSQYCSRSFFHYKRKKWNEIIFPRGTFTKTKWNRIHHTIHNKNKFSSTKIRRVRINNFNVYQRRVWTLHIFVNEGKKTRNMHRWPKKIPIWKKARTIFRSEKRKQKYNLYVQLSSTP